MHALNTISPGDNAPDLINTIIEIPKGSHNKYEIDKETGMLILDRVNYSAAPYHFDYGFVPQTLWEDGDPLDVVVLTTYPLLPGIMLVARPIAVMEMIDSGESDFKIIAVPHKDKRFDNVEDLKDINPHTLKEIQHFFETYKDLKGDDSTVEIKGVKDKSEAIAAIKKSIELYKNKK